MFQNSGSFQAALFSLLSYAEIKAFYWLKGFFLLEFAKKKKTTQKEVLFGTCKPAIYVLQKCVSAPFYS